MKTPLPRLLVLVAAWGLAVALAGAFHVFLILPPVAVQLLIGASAIGFSVAPARVGWLDAAVAQIGVRTLLSFHLVRFIGFYFLWLHAQGRLPLEFAERAGWGDIVAASGAAWLLFWPEGRGFRRALLAWNIFGALDLFVAVGTAGWLNATRPGSMNEIVALPLLIVPLWFVPMLLASHLYLLRKHPICAATDAAKSVTV